MYRHVLHFAFYVPQRQIERPNRMLLFPPSRIEKRPRHVLPEALDKLRILADQPSRTLLQRIFRSPFSNPRNARIRVIFILGKAAWARGDVIAEREAKPAD